jgi:hypothetical protein
MAQSPQLKTASAVMAWLSLVAVFVVAIPMAVGILYPVELHHGGWHLVIRLALPGGPMITLATPLLYRIAVFAVALVPMGLTIWMLLSLFRLFRLFTQGFVFDAKALAVIGRVASLLFAMVLAEIITQPLITFILGRAVGQLWFGYLITGSELPSLFAAGVILVIARVMAEAHRIADENAKFV